FDARLTLSLVTVADDVNEVCQSYSAAVRNQFGGDCSGWRGGVDCVGPTDEREHQRAPQLESSDDRGKLRSYNEMVVCGCARPNRWVGPSNRTIHGLRQ